MFSTTLDENICDIIAKTIETNMKKPLIYKLNTHTIRVLKTLIVSEKLKGMSSGKVFVREDGDLYVNLDDKLHRIVKFKVTDSNDKEIKNIDEIGFDTDKSVRGVLIHNGKLLLHHRIKKDREYFVFPGGHVRMNESLKSTLKREFKEETGLDVNVENLFMKLTQEGFAEERFYKVKFTKATQKLFRQNPDVKEGEVNEPSWVDLKDCKKLNILPEEVAKRLS